MPAKKTPSQAKKRQSKAKPAAKRKAKKKAIVESESDLEPEYDENEEDAEFSPTKYYQDLETFGMSITGYGVIGLSYARLFCTARSLIFDHY